MGKDSESRLVTRPTESFLSPLEQKAMAATGVMYAMTEDEDERGNPKMIVVGSCTATAFMRRRNTYYFVTAAHCVSVASPVKEKYFEDIIPNDDPDYGFVRILPWKWFIDIGESDTLMVMHQAELCLVGHSERGADFAVLKVKLSKSIPIVPLALWDPQVGEPVINVAAPLGSMLDKQLFRGHVSAGTLRKRQELPDHVLLQIPAGPGSSGSAIISQKQKGIIAILKGDMFCGEGTPFIIALPVSALRKFIKLAESGKYPYPAFMPKYFTPKMLGIEEPDLEGFLDEIIKNIQKGGEPPAENKPDGPFGEGESELSEPPPESPDLPSMEEIPE